MANLKICLECISDIEGEYKDIIDPFVFTHARALVNLIFKDDKIPLPILISPDTDVIIIKWDSVFVSIYGDSSFPSGTRDFTLDEDSQVAEYIISYF